MFDIEKAKSRGFEPEQIEIMQQIIKIWRSL